MYLCVGFLISTSGCVPVFPPRPDTLFTLPLSIEGAPVGEAIVDTGGAYELILREDFGLGRQGEVDVLAFGGIETVAITEDFRYSVGGVEQFAHSALVGLSVCDCNGVGFEFFRKSELALEIDFDRSAASLIASAPTDGVSLEFAPPPEYLSAFDSSFIEIEVASGGRTVGLLGLLDTGSNGTFIRRGILPEASGILSRIRLDVTVAHSDLGTVAANVGLFETEGLPDVIIGTDVMRVWARRWTFSYHARGGRITAHRWADPLPPPSGPAN